ncbi:phage tail tape measure protein [Oceanobacillus oncorhynchi]|uniref:phage tail tape measure protein n=1 Tax=Oceanobacillus oncorhynchi TaxID=545501 RepID=UPI0018694391|nr:phage tail tape measure protein [Oceanobacillus oncorhynchi]
MADTAKLTVRIGANIADFEKKMKEMQGNLDKIGGKMQKAGKGLTAGITAPIMGISTAAFAAANDYDKAFNTIRVETGATGSELTDLENNFKSVFNSVPTDSETAASALTSLNSATGATGDTLEGLTTGVLEASRMMGEDGATNAGAFGKALNQWQIPAEDGEQALDRLFSAAQNYDIGMGDLMGTMSAYGPVLQNAGFEMHEAADLFGRLEDSGISVSRVMPGLNSAFRNWAAEGKDARTEFDKTITQMQEAETETEALSIATEAFGAEGAQRLTTAIRNGVVPSLDDLGGAIEDSEGAVGELSEETMTVGDRFTLMRNKIQDALVPLGETLIGIFEGWYPYIEKAIGWIQDLGNRFANLSPQAQLMVVAISGIAAAVGPLLVIGGSLIKNISSIIGVAKMATPVFTGLGAAISFLASPIGIAIAALAGLAAGITYLWNTNEGFREAILSIWESIKNAALTVFGFIRDFLVETWQMIQTETMAVWEAISGVISIAMEKIQNGIQIAVEIITALWDRWGNNLLNIASAIWETIKSTIQTAIQVVSNIIKMVMNLISGDWGAAWENIREIGSVIWEHIKTIIKSGIDIVKNVLQVALDAISTVWNTTWDWIRNVGQQAWNWISDTINSVFTGISNFFSSIWSTIKNTFNNVIDSIVSFVRDSWNNLENTTKNVFKAVKNFLKSTWTSIRDTVTNLVKKLWNSIKNIWNTLRSTTENIFSSVWNFLKDTWERIRTTITDLVTSLWNSIKNTWDTLLSTTQNIFGTLFDWLSDTWNSLWSTVTGFADDIFSGVSDAWNSLWDATKDIFNDIKDWISDTFDNIVEFAKDLPGRIGDGIANMKDSAVDGVKEMINFLADKLEDGVNFVIGGLNNVLGVIGVGDDAIPELSISRLASGTNNHPGGPAMINDGKGPELVKVPGQKPGFVGGQNQIVNLPKGSKVMSYEKTNKMMGGQVPAYAGGIGGNIWSGIKDFAGGAWEGIKSAGSFVVDSAKEGWDFLKDGAKKAVNKLFDMAGMVMPKGDDFFSGLVRGSVDSLKENLISFTDNKTAVDVDVGGDVKRWTPLVQQALTMNDLPPTEAYVGTWLRQIQTESGGNPAITQSPAVRDINALTGNLAQGLVQVIPPTFEAYKHPGYNDPFNPLDNLLAGINYAKSRYGASGMLNAVGKGQGYARGGIIRGGEHQATINEEGPEAIIPLSASRRKRANKIYDDVGGILGRNDDGGNTNITVNNTYTNANPSPSEISRKQKQDLRGMAARWT